MTPVPKIDGVLEACLYVDDLEAAQVFYSEVLGLEVFSPANGRDLFFRCGSGMFLLFDPSQTRVPDPAIPSHGATGPGHVAFSIAEEDLDDWRRRLTTHKVAIEQQINWPNQGRSIYFRDPAGNSVELATPRLWGLLA